MSFISLRFMVFMGALLLLYWLLPRRSGVQNLLILASSILFYACSGAQYLIYLLLSALLSWLCPLCCGRLLGRARSAAFAGFLLGDLAALLVFKYAEFFSRCLSLLLGAEARLPAGEAEKLRKK